VLAPIALFVYARPAHTRRTVEALRENALAAESDLVIFSDGPKTQEAAAGVRAVRDYIRTVSGFRTVRIVERETNWGLAKSIIGGVTELCERRGRVIVLEDDLVTSTYFLRFMNDALARYEAEETVMHVSGYMFPVNPAGLPPTFFLRTASCWGWATWQRAWRQFSRQPARLMEEFSAADIRRFNFDGAYDFWDQVRKNASGRIDTWAVFWYATIFRAHGLCLHPASSMTNNIGHDSSGQHRIDSGQFQTELAAGPVTKFEACIAENALAYARLRDYFFSIRPSPARKLVSAIARRLR
jgi:hypothetical protein